MPVAGYDNIDPRQKSCDVIVELKLQICGSWIWRVCGEQAELDGGLVFGWEE
jgi:hypothetical protein